MQRKFILVWKSGNEQIHNWNFHKGAFYFYIGYDSEHHMDDHSPSKQLFGEQQYGAYINNELVGVIATRNHGNHIALFFVDGAHHRQGIGRKLFETVLKNTTSNALTVNSSPYAKDIYHHLGFEDTDIEQMVTSIRFIQMKYRK